MTNCRYLKRDFNPERHNSEGGGLMPRPDYTGTSISSSLDAYSVLIFWENPCRLDRSDQVSIITPREFGEAYRFCFYFCFCFCVSVGEALGRV